MRYSTSLMAAIVISFFLFLGMSMLIQNKNTYQSNDFEMTGFTMIKEMDTPLQVKPNKPTIPEKQEVKQPPAAPKIEISSNPEQRPTLIPTGQATLENMDLMGFKSPVLPGVATGQNELFNQNELIQIVGIQPVYPQNAIRQGIEGWVKVEILVNEQGLVSAVKILDAHPKRIFDQATTRAVLKSKYQPMMVDGKPVAQSAVQVIEFKINQ